ncbi:MAG: SMI1/KNR4 family protein [Acidobacteria bacterium]|nr:SMI1/KNR4 family protein [Acidobacteriota bacterium]
MTIKDYASLLDRLRREHGSGEVFGSKGNFGHHFERKPISAEEITQFENDLGTRLPSEFTEFLINCGCGAGPYYGILSPATIITELRILNENLDPGVNAGNPSLDFPFSKSDALIACERRRSNRAESHLRAPWPLDGCIPICEQGCDGYCVLVTAGELRGSVWSVYADPEPAWWWPAERPVGVIQAAFNSRPLAVIPEVPTFSEWYKGWLERVEVDLKDLSIR